MYVRVHLALTAGLAVCALVIPPSLLRCGRPESRLSPPSAAGKSQCDLSVVSGAPTIAVSRCIHSCCQCKPFALVIDGNDNQHDSVDYNRTHSSTTKLIDIHRLRKWVVEALKVVRSSLFYGDGIPQQTNDRRWTIGQVRVNTHRWGPGHLCMYRFKWSSPRYNASHVQNWIYQRLEMILIDKTGNSFLTFCFYYFDSIFQNSPLNLM